MITFLRRLIRGLGSLFNPGLTVLYVNDRPIDCRPGRLYVTGRVSSPEHGFMACPCGCGDRLTLRFVGERSPRWSLLRDWRGRATVRPSIWRSSGCQSHFFLTRGKIHWC